MFPAAEEIVERFEEKDIRFRVQEYEDSTRIFADVLVDYTSFSVVFIVESEDNDVAVRVPHFVRFLEKDHGAVLRVSNDMNEKYRFCKFTVNDHLSAVAIEYDFPDHTGNIGDAAVEIFQRVMQIAEEAFPVYMRAIWEKKAEPALGQIVFHDFQVE